MNRQKHAERELRRELGWETPGVPERPVPFYLLFLTALTLLYLLVEVPFATFLVELLGRSPSTYEIERAEHTGRLISGVALALAVWGFVLPKQLKDRASAFAIVMHLTVVGALSVGVVYHGEKALVDLIAESARPHQRQQAVLAVAAKDLSVARGEVPGLSAQSVEGAHWNAFMGLMPFLSTFHSDLGATYGASALAEVAGRSFAPDAATFQSDIFLPLMDGWEERFDAYRNASGARQRAVDSLAQSVEDGWNRHVENLRRQNVIGPRATARTQAMGAPVARGHVQRAGVPVPDNWNVFDQETFVRVAYGERMPSINRQYNAAIERIFGEGRQLEPGLTGSYADFIRHPQVQVMIRDDLSVDGMTSTLIWRGMNETDFRQLHEAYRSGFARDMTEILHGDGAALGPYGKYEEIGAAAVRAVWVPVLSLSLSLLGALGHFLKLGNYLFLIALGLRRSRRGITTALKRNLFLRFGALGSLASVMGLLAYSPANAVIDSAYYHHVREGLRHEYGDGLLHGVEWTISWQTRLEPIGHLARFTRVFDPIEQYLTESHGSGSSLGLPRHLTVAAPVPPPRPVALGGRPDPNDIPLPRPRPLTAISLADRS